MVCAFCPGPATSIWPCARSLSRSRAVETLAAPGSVGTLDSPPPAAPLSPPASRVGGSFRFAGQTLVAPPGGQRRRPRVPGTGYLYLQAQNNL